ncbi:MAG: efflux RND transporter periplasmic adaptor subunit [Tannerella sp.]|jgi:RND family efflux transporter MFP subunit|nr:efflux RND transporter periplasmic adaptor subunit [Tannerella sp.]
MKIHGFLIFIVTMGLAGCHSGEHHHPHDATEDLPEKEHPDEILFTRQQAVTAGLKIQAVVPETFAQVIKTSGQIQSPQGAEIILASTADGMVAFANASIADGMAVRAGETIVTVSAGNLPGGDPATQAKIACDIALKEYQRAEALVKQQLLSVKDYEQIQSRYEMAKAAYDAQASNITPGGVKIATPISGFVRNRLVQQGEYVSVGQPLVTISQNKRLQLRADVPEKYFNTIRNIRSVHFKMPYGDTLYKLPEMNGRLLSFGKTAGLSSFCIPVTFEFDNTGDILPGSFLEIYLLSEPQEQAIAVPFSAVTEEQGLYFVYLQLDEEGYKKQPVTLGRDDGERVQVLSGLKAGDRIVTEGACQVKLAAHTAVMPEGHTHH